MTESDAESSSPEDAAGGHLLLERVAAGDVLAFGLLYDAFVSETYAICLHNLTHRAAAEKAMTRIWLYIWSHAAALNDQAGSTRSIVLSTAWAATSSRRALQRPARRGLVNRAPTR